MGALYRKVAEFFRWFFAEPGQLNRAIDEYERQHKSPRHD